MEITVPLTVEISLDADIDVVEAVVVQAAREAMAAVLVRIGQRIETLVAGCPQCGATQGHWDGIDPRVVATSFGRVVLPRRRWRCHGCQRRSRPADRLVACLGSGTMTAALRVACVEAGSAWPFATAARFLQRRCGAVVSAEQVRQLTLAAGRDRATTQRHDATALVTPTAATVRAERARASARTRRGSRTVSTATPPARLLVEMDGGWVPSRDQAGGMEGKVAVVATGLEPVGANNRQRLWPRRYAATFGSADQFGQVAYAAACQLGGDDALEQVVVADGAAWIKTQAALHFPDALTILDWPHVARAVHRAIRAARSGSRHRALRRELHRTIPDLLWTGQGAAAITALQALRVPGESVEALERAIDYLHHQRDWLGDYQSWQQQGYPIGSGAVERAVEVVINRRLSKRGMRWKRVNADAVVALRVDALNDAWDARHDPHPLAA